MYENLRVIELVRVSTAEQAKEARAGIPRQLEDNKRTIERHRLKVVRDALIINDVSGASVTRCPEIRDILLPLLRDHEVDGVVTSDMDRLIRPDNFDDYSLLQRFKENGIVIFTADNVIDLNTRTGFLMGGMKATIAGDDLSNIKKKMLDGKEQRRMAGKHPNSRIALPKGIAYDRTRDAFTLAPDIEAVREMFRLYVAEGWFPTQIGRRFGITPRGVALMLANPIYAGWRVWDQKRGEKYARADGRQADRRKVKRRPDEIVVRRIFDAAPVPEAVFARAQTLLNETRASNTQRRSKFPHRFYYTGMLRCAVDDEVMYSRGNGGRSGRIDYHVCRRNHYNHQKAHPGRCASPYANRVSLYRSLDALVTEILANPAALSKLFREWLARNDQSRDTTARRDRLLADCKAIQAKRTRYLALYGDGQYSKAELDSVIEPLARQLGAMQAELVQIRAQEAYFDAVTHKDLAARIAGVFREFRFLTPEQKRLLLKTAGITFSVLGTAVHAIGFNHQMLNPHGYGFTDVRIGAGDRLSTVIPLSSLQIALIPPYVKVPDPAKSVLNYARK